MLTKDYYQIMGLAPDASAEEIKKAYRKLAMKFHPDRNRNDPHSVERLKVINDAYHILGNKERKTHYDLMYSFQVRNEPFTGRDSMHSGHETLLRAFAVRDHKKFWKSTCRKRGLGGKGCGRWRQF